MTDSENGHGARGEIRITSSIAGAAYDEGRGLLFVSYVMAATTQGTEHREIINAAYALPNVVEAEARISALCEQFGVSESHYWN